MAEYQHLLQPITIGKKQVDNRFAINAMEGKEKEISWCTACDRCVEFLIFQKNIGCAVYNKYYRDLYREMQKNGETLKAKRT